MRTDSSRRRRATTAVLSSLIMAVGFLATGPTAQAADKFATQINVIAVATPDIDVPDTAGAPASFVVAGKAFDVSLTFTTADLVERPIANQPASIALTAVNGPNAGQVVGTGTVGKDETRATVSGTLSAPANDVVLRVTASIGKKLVAGLAPGLTRGSTSRRTSCPPRPAPHSPRSERAEASGSRVPRHRRNLSAPTSSCRTLQG